MNGNFDTVFLALKKGDKLSRKAWAANVYIRWSEPLNTNPDTATINQWTAGVSATWVPVLADLLATDWYISTVFP